VNLTILSAFFVHLSDMFVQCNLRILQRRHVCNSILYLVCRRIHGLSYQTAYL